MLLSGEQYRWMDRGLYEKKLTFLANAPELNPDEAVWALLKGNLANGRLDDLEEVAERLQSEFRHVLRG